MTYTLAIRDEHHRTIREFTGLSLDMAEREESEWVEVYGERGWRVNDPEPGNRLLTKGTGTALRMRSIQIWEEDGRTEDEYWEDVFGE